MSFQRLKLMLYTLQSIMYVLLYKEKIQSFNKYEKTRQTAFYKSIKNQHQQLALN